MSATYTSKFLVLRVKRETEKAILAMVAGSNGDREVWLPKSQVSKVLSEEAVNSVAQLYRAPDWMVREKGLIVTQDKDTTPVEEAPAASSRSVKTFESEREVREWAGEDAVILRIEEDLFHVWMDAEEYEAHEETEGRQYKPAFARVRTPRENWSSYSGANKLGSSAVPF